MTDTDRGDGTPLDIPESAAPTSVGGATVGPAVTKRPWVKLIRPRKWRRFVFTASTPLFECPYCLNLVGRLEAADEHLWRVHADNTAERAGQMNLLPMVAEIERRLDHLEEDLTPADEPTARWYTRDQTHEYTDRRRRRMHWRRWR